MMTSVDLKVANNVTFALIDLRLIQRPKLKELFRKKTNCVTSG